MPHQIHFSQAVSARYIVYLQDTLEKLDVDEAVSSCFKDPLEDSDQKTQGENLRAKLQKLVSDYREANSKVNGDKTETDDATETKDAREAERDDKNEEDVIKSTSDDQQLTGKFHLLCIVKNF